jgi:hypothetical protein
VVRCRSRRCLPSPQLFGWESTSSLTFWRFYAWTMDTNKNIHQRVVSNFFLSMDRLWSSSVWIFSLSVCDNFKPQLKLGTIVSLKQ